MNIRLKSHISSPLIRWLGQQKASRCFSKAPIFIGGCARSGTSLLLSVLSAHPHIFSIPKETDAFTQWERRRGRLFPVRMDRLYRALLLSHVPASARRWCEKRPFNVRFISEILEYFSKDARFIHIVRDPRAVCTSMHPENPDAYWVSKDRYLRDVSAGLQWINHPQVHTLKYEDLISDTDKTICDLCEFIQEPYTEAIQDWFHHATVRSNNAWFDQLKPIAATTTEKWKSPQHQSIVHAIEQDERFRPIMSAFDYRNG